MYTLYHHPYSQHARRVVSLLEETSLGYELRHVSLDKAEHLSPDYRAINPNHQVPTLVDGDLKIHESNAILRYLCAKHQLTNWYPDELTHRARVEQWLDWNQCQLSPAVVDIVLNKVFLGEQGDDIAIQRGEETMIELTAILEAGLKDKRFLAGDTPTIADLSVASNLFQLGLANATPTHTNITRWYNRMNDLKGFINSLPQE